MTTPQGFDSGGFLSSDVQIDADFGTVLTLDGRQFTQIGTWNATGTKATTTTARASDPKLLLEAPFSDFDFKVDVGYGDAVYARYVDENNFIRISQYQTYSTSSFNYTVDCNPYTCGGYACNPYSCAPYYACGTTFTGYVACAPYSSCNCVAQYSQRESYYSNAYCTKSGVSPATPNCRSCGSCCSAPCPSGYTFQSGTYCGNDTQCTVYNGQICDTCSSYCPTYATAYCASTCYQTCGQYTCYQQCAASTTNYHYPVTLRIEKKVAGTLTTVQDISLGENARCLWLRVVGVGSNIKVYSDRSPSTPHNSTQTVNELLGARKFGVGRHGYGNQDSGTVLDNLVLTNAK